MACDEVWVVVDYVEVIRAENLLSPIGGEPGSSAEWRLTFRVGGLNSGGQEFPIYQAGLIGGEKIQVNRRFTVPEPQPGENVIEVWGVEVDDSSPDDSLPPAGFALNPNSQPDTDEVVLHAVGSTFEYKVFCRVRSASRGVLTETSDDGPSAASWNDNIYIAWTGKGNQRINVINLGSFDKVTLDDTAVGGVALTVHGNRLYMAWTGTDPAQSLNLSYSEGDLKTWVRLDFPPETSTAAPALASAGNALFIAWTGTDDSQRLNLRRSDDGITFPDNAKHTLDEFAITSPSIVGGSAGGIDLAWVGTDGEGHINSMGVQHDLTPNTATKVTEAELSDARVGAAALTLSGNTASFYAWRGVDGEGQINLIKRTFSFGKPDWKRPVQETTIAGPTLLSHRSECLYLLWTGTDGEGRLNYKLLDPH